MGQGIRSTVPTTPLWALMLCAGVLLIGHFTPRHPVTSATTRPASLSLTVDECRQMLSAPLTVAQLKHRLGEPAVAGGQAWGNMTYALPGGKHVSFRFKGPSVTAARYDKTEIRGIAPRTHILKVNGQPASRSWVWTFEMDGRRFESFAELSQYIQSLPAGQTVEHYSTCLRDDPNQPLTSDQYEQLKKLCREANLFFVYHPAG